MMDIAFSDKMSFFSSLLLQGQGIYYWEYDPDFRLLTTNCPRADIVQNFLELSECSEYLRACLAEQDYRPLMLSSAAGLSWMADFLIVNGQAIRIHLLGPVFTSDYSMHSLEQHYTQKNYSQALIREFMKLMIQLPIIPVTSLQQDGIMLHYSLTGETLALSAFNYQTGTSAVFSVEPGSSPYASRDSTWLAEQEAMRMIEEGQLDYQEALIRISQFADYTKGDNGVYQLQKSRYAITSFISLSTRAAIRGGLDIETAYMIGETYTQSVSSAKTLSELMQLNRAMFDDFVHRVHQVRTDKGISPAVQACRNYIDLHPTEEISLNELAKSTGYSDYYLSKKFKAETGISISRYIHQSKIRYAKELLRGSQQSISDISVLLGYANTSYFIEQFRKETDMSPGDYRKRTASHS